MIQKWAWVSFQAQGFLRTIPGTHVFSWVPQLIANQILVSLGCEKFSLETFQCNSLQFSLENYLLLNIYLGSPAKLLVFALALRWWLLLFTMLLPYSRPIDTRDNCLEWLKSIIISSCGCFVWKESYWNDEDCLLFRHYLQRNCVKKKDLAHTSYPILVPGSTSSAALNLHWGFQFTLLLLKLPQIHRMN